jgi:glycerol-3-phosphate dehydrogenase
LCAHAPYVRAEALHAARHEMALRLEDWFLRRSRHGYATCNGLDALEPVAAVFATAHGWDAVKVRGEIDACRTVLDGLACKATPRTPQDAH